MFRSLLSSIANANTSAVQDFIRSPNSLDLDPGSFIRKLADINPETFLFDELQQPSENPTIPIDQNKVVTEVFGSSKRKEIDAYPVCQRCDSLILHGILVRDVSPVKYNLILHVHGSNDLFSLCRTDEDEEAQNEFILFKECLVPLIKINTEICNKYQLDKISCIIRKNHGWTAAHLIAAMNLFAYLEDPTIQPLIDAKEGMELKTPLHVAVKYGKTKTVNALINLNAQMDLTDIDGNSVIHTAAAMPDSPTSASILKILLNAAETRSPLLKYLSNVEGLTPLQIATQQNSARLIKVLLQFGSNFNIIYNILENPNKVVTELSGSAIRKEIDDCLVHQRCDSLILHGPVSQPGGSRVKYNLILHVPGTDKLFSLCRTDDVDEAQTEFILFKECLVPLIRINTQICNKYQLDEISSTIRKNPGWTVAHLVASMDLHPYLRHPTIQPLINVQEGLERKTALHVAVEYGKTDTVMELLRLNALMDRTDAIGNNVLHTAVAKPNSSAPVLNILLKEIEKRPKLRLKDAVNDAGLTPLQIATQHISTSKSNALIKLLKPLVPESEPATHTLENPNAV